MKPLRPIVLVIALLLVAHDIPDARHGATVRAAATQAAAAVFAKAPEQMWTANGVTLRYKEAGTGEAVLLIHGYTSSLESVSPMAGHLATSHRVIAMDVRGFGKSSKFADPARFGQSMVDDVVRLMDHLQIRRAHLIGHSLGALIAANVAARYPDRISTASLIAGPFYEDKATFTKEAARWTSDLESGRGLTPFVQWLLPAIDAKMAAVINAQMLNTNDLPSLIAVMRSLPELAIEALRTTNVPVLVAAGTGDPLHPLSVRLAKASAGARLLELPGRDHISVMASPELDRGIRELLQPPTGAARKMQDAA